METENGFIVYLYVLSQEDELYYTWIGLSKEFYRDEYLMKFAHFLNREFPAFEKPKAVGWCRPEDADANGGIEKFILGIYNNIKKSDKTTHYPGISDGSIKEGYL